MREAASLDSGLRVTAAGSRLTVCVVAVDCVVDCVVDCGGDCGGHQLGLLPQTAGQGRPVAQARLSLKNSLQKSFYFNNFVSESE